MLHKDAGLLEGTGVEEEFDALACGEPAVGVQLGDPLFAASLEDGFAAPAQLFDGGTSRQGRSSSSGESRLAESSRIVATCGYGRNSLGGTWACPGETSERSGP
ncbi:MAG: hypothetical protein AAB011_09995 [Candidatus Eisenbacteria bacterium]